MQFFGSGALPKVALLHDRKKRDNDEGAKCVLLLLEELDEVLQELHLDRSRVHRDLHSLQQQTSDGVHEFVLFG